MRCLCPFLQVASHASRLAAPACLSLTPPLSSPSSPPPCSVFKQSSQALCQWSHETLKASTTTSSATASTALSIEQPASGSAAVAAVASAALSLCKPRKKQEWDWYVEATSAAAAAASSSTTTTAAAATPSYFGAGAGGYDPSMSRWFREILGASGAAGAGMLMEVGNDGQDSKIETRLVTPALRTLELLLAQGCLQALQPPSSSWGSEAISVVRRRVQTCKDDPVRILAAGQVYLGLLAFSQPVRGEAVCALLDLLCHPFPRIRKGTAERLYVRLLTIDDLFTVSQGCLPTVDVDAALQLLTVTPWDTPAVSEEIIAARDSLYALLGQAVPDVRSAGPGGQEVFGQGGAAAGAGAAAAAGKGGAGAAEAEAGDYGALVREMGY